MHLEKNVETILRRRAKWVTKWTLTIGGGKIHITIKVLNVIQRNMGWVLTGNIWESHLSSFCSLQPKNWRLDGDLGVSCGQGDRKAQFWSLFCSMFAAAPALPTATKYSKTDLINQTRGWRSNLNKINVNKINENKINVLYGQGDRRMREVSAGIF